jgi:hypothetical protein
MAFPSVYFNTPSILGLVLLGFIDKKIHHEWTSLFWRNVPRFVRVYGPLGPSSCYGPLTWWDGKELGETLPLLSSPAKAQSLVLGLIRLHYFFMHIHAAPSIRSSSIIFICSRMVYIHDLTFYYLPCLCCVLVGSLDSPLVVSFKYLTVMFCK